MAKVHPTAIVDAGAELADGVTVGPFCIVGPGVRLGARTKLHSSVVIEQTTMGEDNEVWPGAIIVWLLKIYATTAKNPASSSDAATSSASMSQFIGLPTKAPSPNWATTT